MAVAIVDRKTLLRNLRKSRLLSLRKLAIVMQHLRGVSDPREIAKALATWKLVTKFQAQMLLLGRKSGFNIGPYCILDELGHGGMGRVYKAVHRGMRRKVALKILSPQSIDTERAERMFRHEVRASAQLNHPNIVMAFETGVDGGRHYLAMEYVKGPNLEQYATKHGALPVGLACEIIFQAAAGLQHAHERGVVHRDIKPANLLLTREPGTDSLQVKILDFGLSCLRRHNHRSDACESSTLMGTPDYLSPEQARDVNNADSRSDLYSLGCTFYFLLTREVPFPQGTIGHKVNRHVTEQATPIERFRPDVPRVIADIVRKLMAKNPADRFQTPDELMEALAPHAEPRSIDAPIVPPEAVNPACASATDMPTVVEETPLQTQPSEEASERESLEEWAFVKGRKRSVIGRVISAVGVSCLAFIGAAGVVTKGFTP